MMKNNCVFYCCFLFATEFLCASGSYAQVRMPTGKALPTNIALDINDKPARRWCLADETPLHALPDGNSQRVGQLRYLDIVFQAEGYPAAARAADLPRNDDAEWTLLVKPSEDDQQKIGSLLGWVRRKYLLESVRPEVDLETRIVKKAFVVMPLPLAQQLIAQKRRPDPLKPLLAPGGSASEYILNLYEMFFVYGELDGFLLVGRKQTISTSEQTSALRENLIGWLPKDRVAIWNTRECMEWDRATVGHQAARRRPVRGALFLSAEDAIDARSKVDRGNPKGGYDAITEIWSDDNEPLEISHKAMRFHLLQTAREAQQKGVGKSELWTVPNNNLVELGVVLKRLGADGSSVGAEEIQEEQDRLFNLADEIAVTEILFVVDDTESMADWFPRAAEIVSDLVDQLKRNAGGTIRAGVTFYNDGPTAAAAVEATRLVDLSNPAEYRNLAQRLNTHKVHDGGNDPLERVLDGVSLGVDKAGFLTNSRKIVVVLGDCGDKLRGEDLALRIDIVAKQLVPKNASLIEFHAIQVVNPEANTDYQKFKSQLSDQLRSAYLDRVKLEFPQYNERPDVDALVTYTPNATLQTVKGVILPKFEKARREGAKWRALLKKITLQGFDQAEVAEINDPLFKRLLRVERISTFVSSLGIQPYQRAYGWESCPPLAALGDKVPQLRRMLLVNKAELKRVIDMVANLEERIRNSRNADKETLVQEFLERQAGEDDNDIPFELGNRKLGALERSRLLIRSLRFRSDLFAQFLDERKQVRRFTDKDLGQLLLVKCLLTDILDSKKAEPEKYEIVNETVASVKYPRCVRRKDPATGKPYELISDVRGHERYGVYWYYIDFQREWP